MLTDTAHHSDTFDPSATKPTTVAMLLAHPEATVPLWSAVEPNAAGVVSISRTGAYSLARRGEFPVPVIRVGKSLCCSVVMLLDLLGVER